jgi:hypothetical protein
MRTIRTYVVAVTIAVTMTVGLTATPASATYSGCSSFKYSTVDHTILHFVAYKLSMYYTWCWHHSTITSYSQRHQVTNIDALYTEQGVFIDRKTWFTSGNVPFAPSTHGGMRSEVHIAMTDRWGWPFPITQTFRPYIITRVYAGGQHTSTAGGVR